MILVIDMFMLWFRKRSLNYKVQNSNESCLSLKTNFLKIHTIEEWTHTSS